MSFIPSIPKTILTTPASITTPTTTAATTPNTTTAASKTKATTAVLGTVTQVLNVTSPLTTMVGAILQANTLSLSDGINFTNSTIVGTASQINNNVQTFFGANQLFDTPQNVAAASLTTLATALLDTVNIALVSTILNILTSNVISNIATIQTAIETCISSLSTLNATNTLTASSAANALNSLQTSYVPASQAITACLTTTTFQLPATPLLIPVTAQILISIPYSSGSSLGTALIDAIGQLNIREQALANYLNNVLIPLNNPSNS